MKKTLTVLVSTLIAQGLYAQPILIEPPEFPRSMPGSVVTHTGVQCLHVASGSITPGDVDWVQVTLGFSSSRTIVDIDFASPAGRSSVLASVVGGTTRFNMADNNNAADELCGLGAGSNPVGSVTDSVADVGTTSPGTILNVAITGADDSGFDGTHSETFDYELWVYVLREDLECMTDGDCDDGVDCTVDRCDAVDGACHNLPDNNACDDGLFCTASMICDAVLGCSDGVAPCAEDVACDEANDRCVGCSADADCADASFCNGREVCIDGVCREGATPACDDGVDCTTDFCDSQKDHCVHVPRHNVCDDDDFCNGRETCHPHDGCRPGKRRCRPGRFPKRHR